MNEKIQKLVEELMQSRYDAFADGVDDNAAEDDPALRYAEGYEAGIRKAEAIVREIFGNQQIEVVLEADAGQIPHAIALPKPTDAGAAFARATEILQPLVEPDPPEFYRASGEAICGTCLKKYREHPHATEANCLDGEGRPFLRKICSGVLVKL